MKKNRMLHDQTTEDKMQKTAITIMLAVFIAFIDQNHTPAQLRALVRAWLIVRQNARDPWHMAQLLSYLNEELVADGVPLRKMGTYLLKWLRTKPLPKLPKSYRPFGWHV